MTREEFLQTVPRLEHIYAIYSGVTRAPYLVCNEESFADEVTIFTEKQEAMDYAEELKAEAIPVFVVGMEQNQMLRFYTDLYLYGVNGIIYHVEDKQVFHAAIEEVVKKPDHSKVEEKNRPITNPQLQISMLYFMQEARRKERKLKPEQLKELDEEMVVNMTRARYYMPFKEVEVDGKQLPQFLVIEMKSDSSKWIAVFTDVVEFNRFKGKSEEVFKLSGVPFSSLGSFPLAPEMKGFIINPGSVGVPIPQEFMKKLLKKDTPKVDASPTDAPGEGRA